MRELVARQMLLDQIKVNWLIEKATATATEAEAEGPSSDGDRFANGMKLHEEIMTAARFAAALNTMGSSLTGIYGPTHADEILFVQLSDKDLDEIAEKSFGFRS